jgi:hypothetical protein
MPVERGTIATWLTWYRALKFATVYVPNYGAGTIGDVGAFTPDRTRPWIDLGFTDADYESWHGWVTIYFTTPVPFYVPAILPAP